MRKIAAAMVLTVMAVPTMALEKMPAEKGFSGFFNLGLSTGSIESNFLARVPGIDVDLGDDTIDDFGSPDDESITLPAVNLNLGYTFASGKTRVFLGSDMEDFLQFDRSTVLALRHDFDRVGRMQLAFLSSAYPGTEVWADPYLVGEKRKDTEFESSGGRFTWDQIFGSGAELKVTARERDIDDERSGEALGLSAAERKLLDREGDVSRLELGYKLFAGNNQQHIIRPSVAYIDRDLDGDAMSQDGYEIGLSWAYSNGNNFRWVNNVMYQSLDGDKENPIFDEVSDEDVIGIASQMFFPGAFGLEKWTPNVSAIWGESDNDIDFNDSKGWMISAGMFRRF
jgi:hypothetical protein